MSSSSSEDSTVADSSSLAMLLADRDDSIKQIARKSANAKYLEQLAVRLVNHVANHEWTHADLYEHLADDYTAYLEYLTEKPNLESRDAFLEHYQSYAAQIPNYSIEVESVHADVNEKNGTATVWMLINVTGLPKGLRNDSVTVQYFKRKAGKWKAYKQTGIRGMPANL